MIEEYINTIDLTEYPEIEVCYYNAKKNLNPAELLDNSFIKTIVFRDEKEKLEESIKDDMTNLLLQYYLELDEVPTTDVEIDLPISNGLISDDANLDDILFSLPPLATA